MDENQVLEQVHQEPGNRTFSFAKYAECRSERR